MGIKNLSGAGSNFRVSTGAGNFTKQLHHETLRGELGNLRDNQTNVLKVIKKFERPIRLGVFGRIRQLTAYREIKKLEGAKLTYGDKKDVKNLLKHLNERPKEESKIQKAPIINRAEDPNGLNTQSGLGRTDNSTKRGGLVRVLRSGQLNNQAGPRVSIFSRNSNAGPQTSVFSRANNAGPQTSVFNRANNGGPQTSVFTRANNGGTASSAPNNASAQNYVPFSGRETGSRSKAARASIMAAVDSGEGLKTVNSQKSKGISKELSKEPHDINNLLAA